MSTTFVADPAARRRVRRRTVVGVAAAIGATILLFAWYVLSFNAEYEATLVVADDVATLTVERHRWSGTRTALVVRLQPPPDAPRGTFKQRSSDRTAAAAGSPIIEIARDPTPPPMWNIRVFDHGIMVTTSAVRVGGKRLAYAEKPVEVRMDGASP